MVLGAKMQSLSSFRRRTPPCRQCQPDLSPSSSLPRAVTRLQALRVPAGCCEAPLAALLQSTRAALLCHVPIPPSSACSGTPGAGHVKSSGALFVCPWHRAAIRGARAVTGQRRAGTALGRGGGTGQRLLRSPPPGGTLPAARSFPPSKTL